MLIRGLATAALLILGAIALPAQSSYFPVDDVRPGMVGIGRTVFEGDRLDDFLDAFPSVTREQALAALAIGRSALVDGARSAR